MNTEFVRFRLSSLTEPSVRNADVLCDLKPKETKRESVAARRSNKREDSPRRAELRVPYFARICNWICRSPPLPYLHVYREISLAVSLVCFNLALPQPWPVCARSAIIHFAPRKKHAGERVARRKNIPHRTRHEVHFVYLQNWRELWAKERVKSLENLKFARSPPSIRIYMNSLYLPNEREWILYLVNSCFDSRGNGRVKLDTQMKRIIFQMLQ